jgi:hypothetical protein
VIETDVRSLPDGAGPVVGSGWGGDGWGDDDSGDDWGWSEGPFGDDEDARPYRRSRVVRAVAMVTAATVVIGSIGTWVAILAVGPPRASYSVTSVRIGASPPTGHSAGISPNAKVSFVIANDSAQAGQGACRAVVSTTKGVVGTSMVRTPRIGGGDSDSLTMSVPLSPTALSGNGPASARVSCLPLTSAGPPSS